MTARRLARLASVVIALAAPSAAGAGPIGHGFGPGLAVDAAGTAYIAWSGSGNPASLQFCRLRRGAEACEISHAIVAPGNTTSRAFVEVFGGRVVITQYRYGGTDATGLYEFISANRGTSFRPGRLVGTLPFYEAVPGPGVTMSGATDANSGGMLFQNVAIDGVSPAATKSATLSSDHPYRGTVGLLGVLPMVVFTSGSDAAQYRRYDGSGSLNEAANWRLPVELGVASYPKLAGGPGGLFLLASAANKSVFARKWNGTVFGPPVTVADGTGGSPPSLHAFQDAGGRLHAVFSRGDADGLHLVHAVSDDGKVWRSGFVATQSPPAGIADTRVATAPDHIGVAVFRTGGSSGEIRVVTVGPDATAKRKPSITAGATATRAAGTVSVKVFAELNLPSGVARATACKGSVAVSIARGETVIASKTVQVGRLCLFVMQSDLAAAKVASANTLSLTFRFSGNDELTPLEQKESVRVE